MAVPDGRRILTTHTGSLPRPEDLAQAIRDRDAGSAAPELDRRVEAAVAEIVGRQVDLGLDVVNDGEMGKVGYSTYVKERLSGFEGQDEVPWTAADLVDHPAYAERRAAIPIRRPVCTGEIRLRDPDAARRDVANLQRAAEAAGVQRLFMTAASPGVIALFLPNRFYPSREAYLVAIAEAMRPEYQAITGAGITLQLDCPDLAMGHHTRFAGIGLEEFRREAALNVEALNHAVRDIPPERMRLHLCWGNYEGPHHHDVELRDIVDLVLRARPAGISLEASNPRHAHEWQVFEDVRLPEGRYLVPGVIDSTTHFVEHPQLVAQRLLTYTRVVGADAVMAGTDCGFGTFVRDRWPIVPSVTWAKLQSLVEGARVASARITGGSARLG
jgi:5-methyltetrahydropteroyltriglutamate--homocysteine methyltransferase